MQHAKTCSLFKSTGATILSPHLAQFWNWFGKQSRPVCISGSLTPPLKRGMKSVKNARIFLETNPIKQKHRNYFKHQERLQNTIIKYMHIKDSHKMSNIKKKINWISFSHSKLLYCNMLFIYNYTPAFFPTTLCPQIL